MQRLHKLMRMDDETAINTKDLRKRIDDFIKNSSFSNAFRIFASKSWLKRLFWVIAVLTAFGGFLSVTSLNIRSLLRKPMSTSIYLSTTDLKFPAVTVCTLNFLNTTTLNSAGENVVSDLSKLFDEIQKLSHTADCKLTANKLASDTGYNISWGDLITLAGNDLSELLLNCTYAGEDCSAEDFEPISTVGGLCYTFNGPKTKELRTARGKGIRKGLRLQLVSNLRPLEDGFSIGRDYGYRIVIHNPDEPPRPESDGIVAAFNSTAYIGMRKVNSIDKTVYSSGTECKNDNVLDNQELSISKYSTYSPSLCEVECFYKYVIDQCGCAERTLYSPIGDKYKEIRNCSAPDICCEVQAYDAVDENCTCPPRCETVEYHHTTSSSTSQRGNQVGVNVFYESLVLETRETIDSYTPWSFISDIGGNLGNFSA